MNKRDVWIYRDRLKHSNITYTAKHAPAQLFEEGLKGNFKLVDISSHYALRSRLPLSPCMAVLTFTRQPFTSTLRQLVVRL